MVIVEHRGAWGHASENTLRSFAKAIELGCQRVVARLIERSWNADKTVVTSFDLALLDAFAALTPSIPLGLLNRNPDLDMVGVSITHRHRWICPRANITTQQLIAKAHAAGLLVYVYRVNEAEIANQLISLAVDAVGTDHPEMVATLLTKRAR